MRILPLALVASVVIHTGAIAWALTHKIDAPELVTVAAPVEITVETVKPPPPPEEIAVALLDDHTIAATTHSAAGTEAHAAAHISTGTQHTQETAASTPPKHSSMMTMRKPDVTPLKGPSDEFWKKFEENTKPLQPKDIAGERIADEVATEAAHLNNPRWIANASPEEVYEEREKQIASRQEQDGHELKQDGQGFKAEHATFTAHVDPDGTAHIDRKQSYDPTEIVMNRHNIDPYASNKKRMLDGTREERYEIGKQYKKRQLMQSAVIAEKNLNYLWAKTTDTAERKEALFEMWDECAETGSDELVAGGMSARKMVVGFIRGHMTGPLAYTAADLAAFNAKKQSHAQFDPYSE